MWAWIIGTVLFLAAVTTLLCNSKEIREWFSPPKDMNSVTSQKDPSPPTDKKILHLTLRKICKNIDSMPLAQRSETAQKYIGINIKKERLKLFNIQKNPDGSVYTLSMVFPEQSSISYPAVRIISCDIEREKCPELNGANEGDEFYVSGQIEEAYAKYIRLSNVSLKFE